MRPSRLYRTECRSQTFQCKNSQVCVELTLTDEGKTKFAEATEANVENRSAIVYDDGDLKCSEGK